MHSITQVQAYMCLMTTPFSPKYLYTEDCADLQTADSLPTSFLSHFYFQCLWLNNLHHHVVCCL